MNALKVVIGVLAISSINCTMPAEDQIQLEDIETAEATMELLGPGEMAQFMRGQDLFKNETFGGNGRTCATCHLRNSVHDNFDFTPADAQAIFAADPLNPLFRPIDSDDGAGQDYSTLLNHGLVRVSFKLPPNVTVDELDSPLVDVDPTTGEITVTVLRSTPSIENMALEESLMWDGRFGGNLERQAEEAVIAHAEPGRLPTAAEKEDLAFYQEQIFTNQKLKLYAKGVKSSMELPKVPNGNPWASERRGRAFFVSQGPIDADHRGLCASCHSGPMLDTTDEFNPAQPAGEKLSNQFVSELNSAMGLGLPELTYRFTLTEDLVVPAQSRIPAPPGFPLMPKGTVLTLVSSDPGRMLVTGNPCEFEEGCVFNPGSTMSLFRISSLWGVADTAPYFHDNSAATLEEVLDVYEFLFSETATALQNPAFLLTPQDRADILAYMNFAFKRDMPQ